MSYFLRICVLLISLFITGNLLSQNVGINKTNPDYTLDVRTNSDANNSILNLSNPSETDFLRLIGPRPADPNPALAWKEGVTLNFYMLDSDGKTLNDYLKFNGRGIGFYNTGESVFLGDGAGSVDDMISNHNVGIGKSSMLANISGVSNVAIGSGSLSSNVGGNDNVILGRNAANKNVSGNFNVSIGHSALFNNQSGARNTIIGTHAGQGQTGVSYSGNVMIGYEAGKDVSASDKLYIDNTSTADPLIYGEFDNNLIKINGDTEVAGNLNLGENSSAPKEGDIRYNSAKKDFQGYNGEKWLSLTIANQYEWGFPTGPLVEKYSATPSDGQTGDNFGFSVSISGDYAVVGAPEANGKGKAYIFHYVNGCWVEEAIITDIAGQNGDQFGYSVSISGDYVIVSAPYSDFQSATDCGKALVFQRNGTTWSLQSTLNGVSRTSYDLFGYSTSMEGNYAVVGIPGDTYSVENQGSIYTYYTSNGTWVNPNLNIEVAPDPTPQAGDGLSSDAFGTSVSISGNKLLVGAPGHNGVGNENNGAFYLFDRGVSTNSWTRITVGVAINNSWVGTGNKVSIYGNKLMFYYNSGSGGTNRVGYINGTSGWSTTLLHNITPPQAPYAYNLSSFSNLLLVGNKLYELDTNSSKSIANLTNNDYNKDSGGIHSNNSVAIFGEKIIVGYTGFQGGPQTGVVYFYHR